jgi:choline dehydrogenase-like flavoprotein
MTASNPSTPFNRWLARDFIEFTDTDVFDLVIVGSGYGAAMAAATFAGCTTAEGQPLRIALLERGCEMLPGAFPSTLDELPGHVRLSRGGKKPIGRPEALFDVRLAGDVNALVANGLGGGSLINGGVMVEPDWGNFDSRLPPGVETDLNVQWIEEARQMLGAKVQDGAGNWMANTMQRHAHVTPHHPLKKTVALQRLATANTSQRLDALRNQPAAITVRLNADDNAEQAVALTTCSLCGDCLTGCNVGAKASLDTNLLVDAQRRGLQVFTSASVLRLNRTNGLWVLDVVHTDTQVQGRRKAPVTVRAHKVVLAAGSLGSTEILLRSRKGRRGLHLSARLGEQFSLNGDNTATVRFEQDVNALADEALPLTGFQGVSPRRIGPEITHMLRWPADASGPGFLVQEFSVAAPLRGLFQEIVTTRGWLDRLAEADPTRHKAPRPDEHDPLALDAEALQRELMVGLIGHDSARGRIELPRGSPGEGSIKIRWPGVGHDPAMADAFDKLNRRVKQSLGASAHITPNPMWRLLPDELGGVVGAGSGGALTVHPLGGCPMGATHTTGVVNEWGAVFNLDPNGGGGWNTTETSLLVLDGAMVPASLGANPALTIAALSLRAARHWRNIWGWTTSETPRGRPVERPRARALDDCLSPQAPEPTRVQIIERLWGRVDWLNGPQGREIRWVELTFAFEPLPVAALTQPLHKRLVLSNQTMDGAARVNCLRIYRHRDLQGRSLDALSEQERECLAEVRASLQGHMNLLEREPSLAIWRRLRAFGAFVRNRAAQDVMRYLRSRSPRDKHQPGLLRGFGTLLKRSWRLASQAGEVRRFEYSARVNSDPEAKDPSSADFWKMALLHSELQGHKRFTYAWGENPWNQLLYLNLQWLGRGLLPGWWWPWRRSHPLKLDARFLAGQGVPLLRITEQPNQVRALTDLAHLGLYWTRLFTKLQLWHLRQPDAPPEGAPQRLPGAVKGLPAPDITELDLEPSPVAGLKKTVQGARRAVVRLTRYRGRPCGAGETPKPPLVFIHGYSASGTTFAHNAIEHPAALHFWRAGRDVWLLDLRTSAGMPTAREPWAFEDAAWADIPVAIDHIARLVGRERRSQPVQVDVFAHCIGAVMLSMALLSDPSDRRAVRGQPTRYPRELDALPTTLRKVVLSQKGFYVDYTDANILRSYLMNFFKAGLQGGYSFRPSPLPRQGEQVFDAFLNTLPYPPKTWSMENPWWRRTPWSATRRRMDALYERTFNIERMPKPVLERIDDFFGPLNLETVSQVIHIARHRQIALSSGQLLSLDRIVLWPRAGTLILSATDSGMVSPHTGQRMADLFKEEGIAHRFERIEGGHQDMLMGRGSERLWHTVEEFLDA